MKPYRLEPTIGTMPDHLIPGRLQEIKQLLRLLISQSVLVEQLRRMGKTFLLRKLVYICNQQELPEEFKNRKIKAKYFSFQGKQNLAEILDILIKELEKEKSWFQIDFITTYDIVRKVIGSTKVKYQDAEFSFNLPEFKRTIKELFFAILDDIADSQMKNNSMLIMVFDELPIMLWEWYREGKHEEAIELLDILRERRQDIERKNVRLIYCGSIGFNVVLDRLKEEFKYTGEGTNDMFTYSLQPFGIEDSSFLCECYALSDMKVVDNNNDRLWNQIYKLTSGLPFYISKIFAIIKISFDNVIDENNIDKAYRIIIEEPTHHKDFNQVLDRFKTYYNDDIFERVNKILKLLAREENGLSEKDILKKLNEKNNDVLFKLHNDEILQRNLDGNSERSYKFKYEIFRQWMLVNKA